MSHFKQFPMSRSHICFDRSLKSQFNWIAKLDLVFVWSRGKCVSANCFGVYCFWQWHAIQGTLYFIPVCNALFSFEYYCKVVKIWVNTSYNICASYYVITQQSLSLVTPDIVIRACLLHLATISFAISLCEPNNIITTETITQTITC